MSGIKIDDVTKNYLLDKVTVPALKGISLEINPAEVVCLMGPSGSGKTTLLNLIGAIDVPTTGKVYINGTEITTLSDAALSRFRNETMGFIFQAFNLIPVLSVFENVEYPLLLQKTQRQQRRARVMELLGSVGLEDFAKRRPDELSGGQRQRVAIARALVSNPKVIVADEPTASLDHTTGKGIMQLLMDLNQQYGTTIIFATHDPMVSEYATSIIKIFDGSLVCAPC